MTEGGWVFIGRRYIEICTQLRTPERVLKFKIIFNY